MQSRIKYIDIAKGISIFLVAMYHSHLKVFIPDLVDAMALFRVPLFFFLAGLFFSDAMSLKRFLLKKSDALLKPYFSVLLVYFLMAILFQNTWLPGIFYGNGLTIPHDWAQLWFLTHLFSVYCFCYLLHRFSKFPMQSNYIKYCTCLLLLVVGTTLVDRFWFASINIFGVKKELPGLPFSLDLIFITSAFFIFGHSLKDKLTKFSPNIIYLTLSVIIFLSVVCFTEASINLNQRIYSYPIFSSLGALSGIYMVMCISWLFSKQPFLCKMLLLVGESSLFILIFHRYIESAVFNYWATESTGDIQLIIVACLSLFFSIFIPILIKHLVIKSRFLSLFFFPFKRKAM